MSNSFFRYRGVIESSPKSDPLELPDRHSLIFWFKSPCSGQVNTVIWFVFLITIHEREPVGTDPVCLHSFLLDNSARCGIL